MNTTNRLFAPTHPGLLGAGALPAAALALWLLGADRGLGQGYSVTGIVPGPGAVSVNGLNSVGQVVGTIDPGTLSEHGFSWANGTALNLGALGGSRSQAYAVNKFGQVAGYATIVDDAEYHAFVGIGQTLVDLGTLGGTVSAATSISDGGHVAGYSSTSGAGDFHAFLHLNNGVMQDLGTLGGTMSSAVAVNDAGQVTGDATRADGQSHAFLYSPGGSLRDLGTLGGTYSSPATLNSSGWVVGESTLDGDLVTHAFLWDGTALVDLQSLGGTFSSAYSINLVGDVVGDSLLAGDLILHSFLYRGGSLLDLGTLGGNFSSVYQINNSGQIVGVSRDANGQDRAFLWQAGAMQDLNSFLPSGSDWLLTSAFFINDAGQIVGLGLYQGVSTWYLLTPRVNQNQPPVADAGPDQSVPCPGTSAVVSLDGSRSTDPDGDTLRFEWFEGGAPLGTGSSLSVSLPLGSHVITLRVTDPSDASAEDTVAIAVVDSAPPMIHCPEALTVSAGENGLGTVPDLLSGLEVSDNGTLASRVQVPGAGTLLPCGTHTVVVTVTDAAGNASSCSVGLIVADTTPPVIASLQADPNLIRPPNHKMVPVTVSVVAADNCDPNPLSRIVSVTSSELSLERGSTDPDWLITGDLTLQVRAEITDKSQPRVYTVKVVCTDASGNRSCGLVTISVSR